ncbi:MAG: hypothetical protein K9H62_19825 [Bacteroidales bacterium]|nr:hypothetical protein [Bacteroidales bacterium]
MPRLSAETKKEIQALPRKSLEEIVLKLAAKDKLNYDFLMINYLDRESGEKELFEKAKADLEVIFDKNYKGYTDQLRFVKMLTACIKRINEFTKVSKNKVFEARLLMLILDDHLRNSNDLFGTCFTTYDTKLAIILKRLINLVTKLHPDYMIDFQDAINDYLNVIHSKANHIDTVYFLPATI